MAHAVEPSRSTSHYPDHLGSTTVITDAQGAVVQRMSYKPFGGFAGAAPSDGAALHHYFVGKVNTGEDFCSNFTTTAEGERLNREGQLMYNRRVGKPLKVPR